MEFLALLLFALIFIALMMGFPVALTLSGVSLIFALVAVQFGWFDLAFLQSIPNRIFGIMTNPTLTAVPLFVFMGIMLEKSKLAEQLLGTMDEVMRGFRGGLGLSVILVGALLAASTGIVGATVVTMGDVLSSAYQQAQLEQGIFSPETLSVGDLFVGALFPGMLLVVLYMAYVFAMAVFRPHTVPADANATIPPGLGKRVITSLIPPLALIVLVLGSILGGFSTPTEAASLGALGAMLLAAAKKRLNLQRLQEVMRGTLQVSSMIFLIFIGAAFFSLTFRGLGGDDLMHDFLTNLPGGVFTAVLMVMVLMFIIGFFLDFIEITYIIVPVVAPILFMMGVDPIWLGIMIAINLQTAFLTPPFGFALFYLRGVTPPSVATVDIYKGVLPYILIQLSVLVMLAVWPELATWLPSMIYQD
jgi:TRAP-type mannitol/chloroaromatic compound transport system permease large subunit